MLDHRLRRWSNIEPTLGQCIVFAWWLVYMIMYVFADRTRSVVHRVARRHLASVGHLRHKRRHHFWRWSGRRQTQRGRQVEQPGPGQTGWDGQRAAHQDHHRRRHAAK